MHSDHQDRPNVGRPGPFDQVNGPAMLDDDQALQVVLHLARELPEITDQQAIVAVRSLDDGTAGLTDVTLHDDGTLTAPADASGIAVVTSDWVDANDARVQRQQIVVIRRDGSEIGADRLADSTRLSTWREAATAAVDTDIEVPASPTSASPKDVAANIARRAFGARSKVGCAISVREIGARIWLARVTDVALQTFDSEDGPQDVAPSQLQHADEPVIAAGDACTWPQLRAAAVDGGLRLGPYEVAPTYAAWLDEAGFAQLLDQLLPSSTAMLGTLEVTGGEQLTTWTTEALSTRGLQP